MSTAAPAPSPRSPQLPEAGARAAPRLAVAPYDIDAAAAISAELDLSHELAQILVRRGQTTPAAARAWLAADERHGPEAFAGIEVAVALVLRHVAAGTRITVHGDYDVDGVCSTAIVVRSLRRLGASVDWFLPSRVDDGYGLSAATVERLAARGTRLLITVDCAITAVEEVAAARAAGMDVLVTDHHAPRPDGVLPDAPIVHPSLCGYPCPDLCAAGVALKLAEALETQAGGVAGSGWADDVDLAALATVADCVPLAGENRRIVTEGLRAIASTEKAGLRALMRTAQVDPGAVDARAIGFRLAPRINAAGRLYRADAGLELVLTDDADRGAAIATELDRVNAERRDVETRIRFDAEAQARAAGPRLSYVLAGEGWHPGVIGIVASRIAERYQRPTVLIALDGGRGTGSGRSIPAFDLLAGFRAGEGHLLGFGGHRAAAGCTIARDQVNAFREAFEAHARATLSPEDLIGSETVDAVVGGGVLDMSLAEELARLAPFGTGNPEPTLLVPAATLHDPRAMGEGKHLRFTLQSGGARSRAVAFGVSGGRLPVAAGEPADVTVSLEVNRWNGAVEPRVLLGSARPCDPAPIETLAESDDYLDAALAEFDAPLEAWPPSVPQAGRTTVDRRGIGIAGVVADLVVAGDSVLVVCQDVAARLGPLQERVGGFALCSYAALEREPSLADRYRHVVAIDPPLHAHQSALLVSGPAGRSVQAWGEPELRFTQQIHELEYDLRAPLAGLYRVLRDRDGTGGEELEAVLRGDQGRPRPPAAAGRLLRILAELRLVTLDRDPLQIGVPPSERTELDRSAAFRAYRARYEDGLQFLSRATARAA